MRFVTRHSGQIYAARERTKGMGMEWYLMVLKKYAEFDGRSRRKEYWMYTLFTLLIYIVLTIVDVSLFKADFGGFGVLGGVYSLATLIPGLAVTVRRLHDTNKSGWWILIAFLPLVGALVLLVFTVTEGDRGRNNFGDDPKGRSSRKEREDDDRW